MAMKLKEVSVKSAENSSCSRIMIMSTWEFAKSLL
jgi:hypothetical protein